MAIFTFDFRPLILAAVLTAGNIILCNSADTTSSSTTSESTTSESIVDKILPDCVVDPDSVSILVFSSDFLEGINANETNDKIVLYPNVPIYFIAHGFNSEGNSTILRHLAQNLTLKTNQPVFSLDWSNQACDGKVDLVNLVFYPTAVSNVRGVGLKYGRFILNVVLKYGLSIEDIVLIGHSLGAHVMSFAAKKIIEETGKKVGMLNGLDPAAPGFATNNCSMRLCDTDAHFVEVIHTSGLGIQKDLGSVDFYFNGGLKQPGCFIDISCSHSRSIEYLTNTLDDDCLFIGTEKEFFGILKSPVSDCTPDTCSIVGFEAEKLPARGSFAVTTSDTPPFCEDDPCSSELSNFR